MLSYLPVARSARRRIAANSRRAEARWPAVVALMLVFLAATPVCAATLDDRAAVWAAEDARTVARAAPRLVDGSLSPVFAGMDRRVGAYADWVYGWFSSLLTAWDLAATGVIEAQREISAGRVPDPDTLYDRLAEVVQQRFDDIVALPDRTTQRIDRAWHRSMKHVADLDAALAAERTERVRRLAARLGVDPDDALAQYGGPRLRRPLPGFESLPAVTQRALSDVEDSAGGSTDRVLIRSLRPLATRSVSVTIRFLLAPAIGGLIASPVAGSNGLAAAVATMAGVSAGIWGIDYAANRIDSALTRPAFEAALRALVRDAQARTARILRTHAEAIVCEALADPAACPAAPPVAGGRPGG